MAKAREEQRSYLEHNREHLFAPDSTVIGDVNGMGRGGWVGNTFRTVNANDDESLLAVVIKNSCKMWMKHLTQFQGEHLPPWWKASGAVEWVANEPSSDVGYEVNSKIIAWVLEGESIMLCAVSEFSSSATHLIRRIVNLHYNSLSIIRRSNILPRSLVTLSVSLFCYQTRNCVQSSWMEQHAQQARRASPPDDRNPFAILIPPSAVCGHLLKRITEKMARTPP